jgi:cytochrome c oxidase cbb3-type subunit 3
MNWLNDNVNALSLLGAAVILILTFFVVGKYMKQMKTDKSSGELTQENWDGIGEYKNALPIGWALSFVGTIVWAAWYFLAGYPLATYSQLGEYNEEVKSHNTKFESKFANPDKAVKDTTNYNYIKIFDKDYTEFMMEIRDIEDEEFEELN